ncbi:methanethiol S-methyltransferase [Roseateles sp. BYS78W]|uniref:methanethiol S-methyltransferase n=1 Tax=Pelomonas candidula TaxID=3299025 RepID=A0ABW7HBA7_9BURK
MPLLALLYAAAAYLVFLATFAWTVGFVFNLPGLPKTIDSGAAVSMAEAIAVNLALMALFAVQHSVMARRGFKQWWTRFVPPSVERATYVLAASAALALLLWQWRPIAQPLLWSVQDPAGRVALQGLAAAGWLIALVSTYLIDHFALFGLRQPWAALRRQAEQAPAFRTPLLYRHVRHPLYLGFLLAFWATPQMTAGHALFAAVNTAYILIGIAFEERDLIAQFGPRYLAYRQQVGMLLPRFRAHLRALDS